MMKGGDHMQVEEGKAKLAKTTLETTLTYFRGYLIQFCKVRGCNCLFLEFNSFFSNSVTSLRGKGGKTDFTL